MRRLIKIYFFIWLALSISIFCYAQEPLGEVKQVSGSEYGGKSNVSQARPLIFLELILIRRNKYAIEHNLTYPSNFSEFMQKDYGKDTGKIYFNVDGSVVFENYKYIYTYDAKNSSDSFNLSAIPDFKGGRYFAAGKSPGKEVIVIVEDLNRNGKVDSGEPILYPKVLIIHVTGFSGIPEINGLNPEKFKQLQRVDSWVKEVLKKQWGDTNVFETIAYPDYKETERKEASLNLLEKDVFPKDNKILIEVPLRYYGNVYQWTKESKYPGDVLKSFDSAAEYISIVVKKFKELYPNSQIMGFSMSIGANVLIRAIEKNVNDFDPLFLVVPPIKNEKEFNDLLLRHGYNASKVIVLSTEGDEFAPVNLQGSSGFTLIRKVKE